jgi:hypothetical protein
MSMYRIFVDGRNAYEIDDRQDADRKAEELRRVYPGAKVRIANAASSDLGRIKTPRKAATSRANIAKAHAHRAAAPCNCALEPHRYTCPVYKREAQQRSRAKK